MAASSRPPATACWSSSPSVVDAVRCAVEVQARHGRAQCRAAERRSHRIPHRHQSRRRHRRGRRHLRRRRQYRRAARSARRAGRDLRLGARCTTRCRGKLDFAFEDLGEQALKNIARPVRVYRVAGAAQTAYRPIARRAAAARQAVDRGAAVPEHERRPGAGIFRRRHGRGDHHRAVPHPLAVRHRPQFELHLQGPGGRCEAGRARTRACAMCSKARCARPATGCASPRS